MDLFANYRAWQEKNFSPEWEDYYPEDRKGRMAEIKADEDDGPYEIEEDEPCGD